MGVLFSGPLIQADGKIVIRNIPTAVEPVAQVKMMLNLGYIVKARELRLKLIKLHLEMSLALRRDIFDPENVRGLGTVGMEERLRQIGGVLRVRSQPGKGATVVAEVAIPSPGRSAGS